MKIKEYYKKYNELKKDPKKKSLLFLGFYIIFFIILIALIRMNNNTSHGNEYEDYKNGSNSSFSIKNILNNNYSFNYIVNLDNTNHIYSGTCSSNGYCLFDSNNIKYFKLNDEDFFKFDVLWTKCDNPMLFYDFFNYKEVSYILSDAYVDSTTSFGDGNYEYKLLISTNNLNGTFYFCKCVLPIMKKQRYGKVVNLSSIAAKLGSANASVYSATKAGVLELTACLAREYAEYDVNINCVLPGIIRTPLWNQMLVEMTEENHANKDAVFKSYTDTIPMKRPQEPVDIANAILFLCTDEASNITAQNLGIDGGQTY